MLYNYIVYSTGKIVLGIACVAAISLASTACTAKPGPPILSGWKDIAIADGRALGLNDPHVTNEEKQIKMTTDKGCLVYLSRVAPLTAIEVTLVTVDAHGVPIRFSALPPREEFDKKLQDSGC